MTSCQCRPTESAGSDDDGGGLMRYRKAKGRLFFLMLQLLMTSDFCVAPQAPSDFA